MRAQTMLPATVRAGRRMREQDFPALGVAQHVAQGNRCGAARGIRSVNPRGSGQ